MSTLSFKSTNNCYLEFQAGVTAVLRSWSALRTAVDHSWGGSDSISKADDLRANIFKFFDGSSIHPKMTLDELEDNLLTYMEDEFGVILEDSSEREIASLIFKMYEQCGKGEGGSLVKGLVESVVRLGEQSSKLNTKTLIQSQSGDMDESSIDENEEEGEERDMEMTLNTQSIQGLQDSTSPDASISLEAFIDGPLFGNRPVPKKDLPPPRQLGEPKPEQPQPAVDDEGFAMVTTKRKGNRR